MRVFTACAVMIVGYGIKTVYADTSTGCQGLANTTWTTSLRLNPDFDQSKPLLNNIVSIHIDSVAKNSNFYGLTGTMSSTGSDNFSSVSFYGAQCDQSTDGKITWINTYVLINDSIFRITSRNLNGSLLPTSLNIPSHGVAWKNAGIDYSNKNEAVLNKS